MPDNDRSTSSRGSVIRTVIADDNLVVREGVQRMLETSDDIAVIAAVGDLDELLTAADELEPDVIVTDIRMPPTSTDEGIRAATALRETSPQIGLVVLSQFAEPAYALALFSSGSERRAYLLKDRLSEPEELAGAVRTVADGGSVVDPKVVELLVAAATAGRDPLEMLTPREQEVLAEIAQGKMNSGIAASLGLSERAVEKHINSLFAKLGLLPEAEVHRRVTAVLMYLDAQRP